MRKRHLPTILTGLVLAAFILALPAKAIQRPSALRTLTGYVHGNHDEPLPRAVVYLKNTRSLAIVTSFAEEDGSYRFPALSSNVDYEVYAEYKNVRSDSKTLSAFDSRRNPSINLKIKVDK